jgi:group II intron reverse transcriptase/maturase
MRELSHVLYMLKDRGERGLLVERLYRMLYRQDLFLAAYMNLYGNQGALTPGTDPQDTVDGMSLKRIDKVISSLKEGTFNWKPTRRCYIPKRGGRKRPLSIPNFTDKLVQEAIRILLEAYYEPSFSKHSHGYRPGKGCHTALRHIRTYFTGAVWFIEGDIRGCFDNINHDVLLTILGRNIKDARFLKLIREMLQAGWLDKWNYTLTYSGTPQGGVLSPLLANIYLNELDQFFENHLQPRYTRGEKRKANAEYARLNARSHHFFKSGEIDRAKELKRQIRHMPTLDPMDDEYRRLQYVRYADDFLIAFIGPKAEARAIRKELKCFLARELRLELALEKTRITHAKTKSARFLGYDIRIQTRGTKTVLASNGRKVRPMNGRVWFGMPREVVTEKLKYYTRNGKAIHRMELTPKTVYSIMAQYQAEYRGLVEYYALAHNRYHVAKRLKWLMEQSLVKTLIVKLKMKVTQIYRRYSSTKMVSGREYKVLKVTINRGENRKPLVAYWGGIPLGRKPDAYLNDAKPLAFYNKRTELAQRLLADTCELCGSSNDVQVHHIRALKDLQKKGQRAPKPHEVVMAARRRKTLVVCLDCHNKIHQGKL